MNASRVRRLVASVGAGLLSVTVVLGLPPATGAQAGERSNWRTDGWAADRTSFNRAEREISPATVGRLRKRLTVTLPTGAYPTGPVVAGGVGYVRTDALYALDLATGRILWRNAAITVGAAPTVVGNTLFVGGGDCRPGSPIGQVSALDAATGAVRWRFRADRCGEVWSAPAVVSGRVYVGSQGGLYALDSATGALLWSFPRRDRLGTPAVVAGLVVAGSFSGVVYGLDAATGAERWSFATGGIVEISTPVTGGIVYVHSNDGILYALDATTGDKRWSYTTDLHVAAPAVAYGRVFLATPTGYDTLDATTGRVLRQRRFRGATSAAPVVANRLVFLTHSRSPAGRQTALVGFATAGGRRLWRAIVPVPWGYHGLVVADGALCWLNNSASDAVKLVVFRP